VRLRCHTNPRLPYFETLDVWGFSSKSGNAKWDLVVWPGLVFNICDSAIITLVRCL